MARLQVIALVITTALAVQAQSRRAQQDDWPVYGHDAGGMRYSPLSQITRGNVSQLAVAWTFHTGDVSDGTHGAQRSGF